MKWLLVVLTVNAGGLNVDARKEFDQQSDCAMAKQWVDVTPLNAADFARESVCILKSK